MCVRKGKKRRKKERIEAKNDSFPFESVCVCVPFQKKIVAIL